MLRGLMLGRGVSVTSQFRLTYSMITNMLRVEDLKVRGIKGLVKLLGLPQSEANGLTAPCGRGACPAAG